MPPEPFWNSMGLARKVKIQVCIFIGLPSNPQIVLFDLAHI